MKRYDKYDEFNKWYEDVLQYAKIVDKRYPMKGSYVIMPYGFSALKKMKNIMSKLLDSYGHEEAYFPLLVPEKIFKKEKDFLKGFGGETLRATKTFLQELDEELIIRPTSETAMYPMYSLWIRSWRDLPLKIYQTVNVFRWETKMTKELLRVRELVAFNESHTAHASAEEAEKQIKEAIEIYKKFFDEIRIPYDIFKTPKWETFAGAQYNYDFFTTMPDGKAIELASVINLGQKFAKAFNIKFMDKDEKKKYVYQTCYGISERELGVAISLHGDNKGLRMISNLAPIHIVIVPIKKNNENDKKIMIYCEKIKNMFEGTKCGKYKAEIKVKIDNREIRPGEKYNDWEKKGVPIRLEIGEKEVKSKTLVLARRDKLTKEKIKEKNIKESVKKIIKEIDKTIYREAKEWHKKMITKHKTLKDALKRLRNYGGIVGVKWCGDENCGKKIADKLLGSAIGYKENEKVEGKCIICGKEAKHWMYFGRTY